MSLIGLFGVLVVIALLVWAVPKILGAIRCASERGDGRVCGAGRAHRVVAAVGVRRAAESGAAMIRLRYALVAALPVLTLIAIRSVYLSGYCFPGCSIYTPDNPEFYLFLCYLC